MLEGTVRRSGNRLRVTAQLVSVSDGYQTWSERYDRLIEDIFDIQDEISEAIAENLQVKLLGGRHEAANVQLAGPSPTSRRPTEDLTAYNLYLKGRYWWNKRTVEGMTKAKQYFEQAIEQDAAYALSYTGLGDCYAMLSIYNALHPEESFLKAKAAQSKAIEINPGLAAAHASLGFARLYYDWDASAAERELQRAIELNPEYPSAHQWYGMCLAVMGLLDKAVTEMDHAKELDPFSVSINVTGIWPLYWARRYPEAIARYRKVVQNYPVYWQSHYFLGLNLLQQGEFRDAIYELETARDLSDIPWRLAGLSHAYALAGRPIEARKVLDEMVELSTRRYVSAYDIATACSGLDERDHTLEFLEKALEDRCWGMALIRLEPMFDSLRSDPRFTRLLETMNPSH